MSKKKSFSGSTMKLKDFHGGSIPSDLPLPSAPGVSVRPPDRWGPSAIGIRPDSHHRQRPGSAGSGGGRLGSGFVGGAVDERGPPFLSTPANIGRHFDEDERKPFDASAAFPRRQAPPSSSDLVVRPAPEPVRSDPKSQAQPQPHPHPHSRSSVGATPNAWGSRKEEVKPVLDMVPPVQASSPVNLSSRFAQASAIEKISSGRWQTKPVTPPSPEVISSGRWQTNPVTPPLSEVDVIRFQDTVRVVDEATVRSPLQQEMVKERGFYNEGQRPVSNEGRFGGGPHLQQHQPGVGIDVVERPKLKLLTKTRPVDANETWALDEKQGHQPTVDHVRFENPPELQESMNMPRPGSAGTDVGSRVSERPKLNLKPRSLPVEQLDETTERERKSLFGGARPRELVLKERGVDDVVATNLEVISPANRFKRDTSKTEVKPKPEAPTLATRRGERSESFPVEQRSGRDLERKDFRSDTEKVDTQRASWRNDNWKNNREIEKPVERCPEPETWRKPVEQPTKPEVSGTVSRLGKTASALELAQAFSRPVSDARADNRFPGERSIPGRVQVPFSRLTDSRDFYPSPNSRQINGY